MYGWSTACSLLSVHVRKFVFFTCVLRSASALLEVRRLPHLGLLRQRHTEDKLHLIRHKRRSISISVLDLLPLEAVEQQHSAADAAKKDVPAVAKICGSGAGKGSTNVLEF